MATDEYLRCPHCNTGDSCYYCGGIGWIKLHGGSPSINIIAKELMPGERAMVQDKKKEWRVA